MNQFRDLIYPLLRESDGEGGWILKDQDPLWACVQKKSSFFIKTRETLPEGSLLRWKNKKLIVKNILQETSTYALMEADICTPS